MCESWMSTISCFASILFNINREQSAFGTKYFLLCDIDYRAEKKNKNCVLILDAVSGGIFCSNRFNEWKVWVEKEKFLLVYFMPSYFHYINDKKKNNSEIMNSINFSYACHQMLTIFSSFLFLIWNVVIFYYHIQLKEKKKKNSCSFVPHQKSKPKEMKVINMSHAEKPIKNGFVRVN